jgi:tetraspanin-5
MIAAIGIYAWIEKDTFDNFGRLTMGGTLFFDPALVFVLVGIFMFFIGFAGCVGSLRENTCLLLFVRNIILLKIRIFFFRFVVQFRFSHYLFCSTGIWYISVYLSRKGFLI